MYVWDKNMQRLTFNMIGSRPPVGELDPIVIRERLGILGFLEPAFILKTDETVNVTVNKNIYSISSNLEIKTVKTYVSDTFINLPTSNFGIQEILLNMEKSNDSPAFGEFIDYSVNNQIIDLRTNLYNGKMAYVKYLTYSTKI